MTGPDRSAFVGVQKRVPRRRVVVQWAAALCFYRRHSRAE
jgi:hypothetical protein